jgi:DNA replication protein DnaC
METAKDILAKYRPETNIPRTEVEPPEQTREQKIEQLRISLGLSSVYNTFDTFKMVPGTEKSLALFRELAAGNTKWQMLLCYGGVGNGKSMLCEGASIELYRRGIFCPVMTMPKVMNALKDTMKPNARRTYSEVIEKFCGMKHLILDDVGMGGTGSDWEWNQLEEIVVERYRDNLFTILTTNLDITALPVRIVSRFSDQSKARKVLNTGSDFRLKKK